MKTLLHINYYEKSGGLDEFFAIADEFGYDGVELRWKYRFDDMNQAEYQEKVASLKKKYPDFEITFGGNIEFCRGAQSVVESETAAYLQFLEWAKKELDTKVMNFFTGGMVADGVDYTEFDKNGSGMANEEDYRKSAEGLRIVGNKAAELDMLIALETHNCYLHDLPGPSRKLIDMTKHDAVGLNLDYCNILLNKNKCSMTETMEQLDGKIYYAHLKNALVPRNSNSFIITQLEHGDINNLEFLELLQGNIRTGMIAVEYPSSGDGVIAAQRDIEYVNFLKQRLQN